MGHATRSTAALGTSLAGPARCGAQVDDQGVSYCVWAPDFAGLDVMIQGLEGGRRVELARQTEGYWGGYDPMGRAGDRYFFQTPEGRSLPDPVSRFQPEGVHGPSECIDPRHFGWRSDWRRPHWQGQSTCELHVGTFTPAGTFRAALERLGHLRALGVDAIELLPVADFPGQRNWGYDGVALYAPARCYGRPDDLRALIDAAHGHGLAVILDVVYNHLGPVGNYLAAFCADYFTERHHTPWGAALNLDGPRSGPVRDFLLGNAIHWLEEFRVDGLRLDATHALADTSERHLIAEIADAVHARGGFVTAEDERNPAQLLRDPTGRGAGLDAAWADDFHHQARVALTGTNERHYASYSGTAAALADVLRHGWTYRGQPFPAWDNRPRGEPCRHLPAKAFIFCIENHDQIGNRARGERLEHLVTPAQFRAASVLLLLSPYAPLLFMGQEWAASSPFLYFTDHEGEFGREVSAGRRREFGWPENDLEHVPDPQAEATFQASKLNWDEIAGEPHRGMLNLYKELLGLRRVVLRKGAVRREHWAVEATGDAVALRYDLPDFHWLVLAALAPGPPPADLSAEILRPPPGRRWAPRLSSEARQFGGTEMRAPMPAKFPGPGAVLYEARTEESHAAH